MKLFAKAKDGGPESTVTGYWLIEWKVVVSVALLRFDHGSRDVFHSHAFDSISWILSGRLREEHLEGDVVVHRRRWRPIVTRRSTFHRVFSERTSWVITIRGPWARTWQEWDPRRAKRTTLTDGRRAVA